MTSVESTITNLVTSKRKLDEIDQPHSHIKRAHHSWLPPSVTTIKDPFKFNTSTYLSEIPEAVAANKSEPIVLGVDEAGRGPVLGPMVYGVAYTLESFLSSLQKQYGFADSKILTESKREELFREIEEPLDDATELNKHIGWATTTITAKDISSGMLQSSGKGAYNLNSQAHDTTINLIKRVLQQGVKISKIFVDTVGPPASYQAKLKGVFPESTSPADSVYPIVSAASVVAKVTRDKNIEYYNTNLDLLRGHQLGSGYPSDPNTVRWFKANMDAVFGWCYGFTRFSWNTAKDGLIKNGAAAVIYEDDVKKDSGYKDVFSMIGNRNGDASKISQSYFNSSKVDLI
ncbi:Ribonuclease H2 subunit A [Candida viswanathii]|uniref:Ribonuclease n=1 Tax=Candida viswanathii TaxID=5486 RepID=A0A367YHM6_9ASCO|nr:Ribonuclease H2 subunit A [Candida viswanathii]